MPTFDPPTPNGSRSPSEGARLLACLETVMAWLAQALQVADVPEEIMIASMRTLVVSDELRCVGHELTASGHLAREHVPDQNFLAQPLPIRGLVPLAPRLLCVPALGGLHVERSAEPRPHRPDAWLDAGEPAHNLRYEKGDLSAASSSGHSLRTVPESVPLY